MDLRHFDLEVAKAGIGIIEELGCTGPRIPLRIFEGTLRRQGNDLVDVEGLLVAPSLPLQVIVPSFPRAALGRQRRCEVCVMV